jgi:hypothetical protein
MNDSLWLVNHPLWGNVVGLPTSQNLPIHRILVELPHLTKLEIGKLCRTWMESTRAFVLELLRGLPTSQKVLRLSECRLSLYSTRMNLGALQGGKPHSLLTFCQGEHGGIYRRGKVVLWPMIGWVRPTCQAGRPCNLVGQPSFLLAPPLGIGYLEHCLCWTHRQNIFWK